MVLSLPLSGCYLVSQGTHFLAHQLRARPTARAMERSPEYAEFIMNTEAIREYGVRFIGLRDTKSYTTFVRTDHGHLAYVVSAARPTSFERHLWRYPVNGDLRSLLATLAAIQDSLPDGQTLRTALESRSSDYAPGEDVVSLPEL